MNIIIYEKPKPKRKDDEDKENDKKSEWNKSDCMPVSNIKHFSVSKNDQ